MKVRGILLATILIAGVCSVPWQEVFAQITLTVDIESTSGTGGPLLASCAPSASSVVQGTQVSWTATVSGGLLPYSYSWSGDDSLSGVSKTVSHVYNNIGAFAAQVIVSSADLQTVTTACSVTVTSNGSSPPPSGGGGGGGGSGAPINLSSVAGVIFKGQAYPSSSVTILDNGSVSSVTVAGSDSTFQVSLNNVTPGIHSFSIYAEDANGVRSNIQTFSVSLTAGSVATVSGIFIPPTFSADKLEVKQGDPITFFGQTVPGATVSIAVNSGTELDEQTTASSTGTWSYSLDTLPLELGSHTAKAHAAASGLISEFSAVSNFTVGDTNVLAPPPKKTLIGDLNGDGRVNLIDFSIMAYWYKRANPPANVDLNSDGRIDLTDFSIMAYYWTG